MGGRVGMRFDVLFVMKSLFLGLCVMVAESAAQCPSAAFLPADVIPNFNQSTVTDQLKDRVATLEATIPALFRGRGIDAHAVAVVYGDSTIYSTGLVDTSFLIGSVTKVFTAMGALVLRQQGRLALDDPVKKFLPEFSVINPYGERQQDITLRELMGHLSGLPRELCGGVILCGPQNETEILRLIAQMELVRPPWTGLPTYSNLGIALLAHAWEKVTSPRQSWGEFLQNAILGPLDMHDTGSEAANVTNFAPGFLDPTHLPNTSIGWIGSAGGMYSTALDLAKFLKFLLRPDEELLSKAAIREWIKPTTLFADAGADPTSSAFNGFALPWELVALENQSTLAITKDGAIGSYLSNIAFHPESQLGVVVLTSLPDNGTNFTDPGSLTKEILQGLVPEVQSIHSQIISAVYSGVYTCRRSPDPMMSPNLPNVTFQVLGGSINVTAIEPGKGLVGRLNLTLLQDGQEGRFLYSASLVLKSASELSFWAYAGSCAEVAGGLSGDLDLARPNFPGSVYLFVLHFEPGEKVVRLPSIGAECYK